MADAAAASATPPRPPPAASVKNMGSGSADERLSSLLKSPAFNTASYINLALDDEAASGIGGGSHAEDPDEILQRRTAELALRLQVTTQGCHDEIGRIGAELRAILPRCAADVGRLGVGLGGMRDDAASLLALQRGEIGEGDDDGVGGSEEEGKDTETGDSKKKKKDAAMSTISGPPPPSSLETLATLHALRSNLSLTRSILSAASSWDATLSSVPGLLSAQNLSEAVAALSRLEAGERALRGMPGRSDRQSAIAKMRAQIEVLLKPQLLHALQRMETRLGPLQKVAAMYGRLGKMDGLTEEYVKQRPGEVHRAWFDWAQGQAGGTPASAAAARKTAEKKKKSAADELKFLGEEEDDEIDVEEVEDVDPPPPTAPNPASFVEWLPEWYERVLSLLSEERRRSAAVFGSEMAPEVIARVLMACFHPILSSFKSRLSAIHPPEVSEGPAPPGTGSGAGSLESICAAFESTLQFLSLAYDQMVGFDDGDASPTLPPSSSRAGRRKPSPAETYQSVRAAFVAAASPFAPYQRNFAALERDHTGLAARMVARDVQGAATQASGGGGGNCSLPSLSGLQDAAERLGDLAPYLFPLVEGSLGRYELLNCGYRAGDALTAIDGLLAGHAAELTIAVGTLTASMAAGDDGDGLADAFDEQHVQCALEVLRVAGTFRGDLRAFESTSRERLAVLHGRVRECVERERVDRGAASVAAAMPDSLSAVEVEAVLAGAVCGAGSDTEAEADTITEEHVDESAVPVVSTPTLAELLRLLSSGADGALYPDSLEAAKRLARTCHVFVFDVCSAVPRRALRSVSSLPVWREEGSGGRNEENDADAYGILPQHHVTQVGEHMLALVQALEPFASDPDALARANEAMNGAKDVAVQPWREFAAATGGDRDGDGVVEALMGGRDLAGRLLGQSGHSYNDDEKEDEEEDPLAAEEDEADRAVAAFCNQWLDVVGSAVTGRLLERIMRVHHLSRRGCEHLAVDLNYLVNVFSALGVAGHPHPLLGHFAELAQMSPEDLAEKITARDDRGDPVLAAVRASEVRIALMRGVQMH